VLLIGQRSVNVNGVREGISPRSGGVKATWILQSRLLHGGVALEEHVGGVVVVHIGGREKCRSAVMILVVVPTHEINDEQARGLHRRAELGELGTILMPLEPLQALPAPRRR
jgi:hypothetical protein